MNKIIILILLTFAYPVFSNPNFVITMDIKTDRFGDLIQPDTLFMSRAVKAYRSGSESDSFSYFKKAASLGNSLSYRYLGLMYINAVGVGKDMVKGYSWIKLAALDNTKKHLDLKSQVFNLLTPEQKLLIDNEYKNINSQFGSIAALTRRDRWVAKQKMKMTGSRTGSMVFAPALYDTPHGNGLYNQMKSFVKEYNYGYVTGGEIIPKNEGEEN